RDVRLKREDADKAIEMPEIEVEREVRKRDVEKGIVGTGAAADLHLRWSLGARSDGGCGVILLEGERLERRNDDAHEARPQHVDLFARHAEAEETRVVEAPERVIEKAA